MVSIMAIKPFGWPEGHLLFHHLPPGTAGDRSCSPLPHGAQGLHDPYGGFLSFFHYHGLLETLGMHLQTPQTS